MPPSRPIVILGPTAGGKSGLAIALALRLRDEHGQRSEIIGADSMQIYRHMDAGTAKPSPRERSLVRHHMIDIVEPTQRFTVADWHAQAHALIDRLTGEGVRPIVVGGTNLYIKALLGGLFQGPPANAALRAAMAEVEPGELHRRLGRVDPVAAERIHPNDRKRLTRALEVHELTGRPISEWQTQWEEGPRAKGQGPGAEGQGDARSAPQSQSLGPWPSAAGPSPSALGPTHMIGLHFPTDAVNARINLRVKAMFFPDKVRQEDGLEHWPDEDLVSETRRLESAGLLGPQARKALGYKQVLDHLAGRCTLDEAFEKTKIETRRFARQQRTWLKRFRGVRWLEAQGPTHEELAAEAMRHVLNDDRPEPQAD